MPVDISGAGTITGLQSEGISSQPVFPGNVIQVVQGSTGTDVTSSSDTFVDTGLSASITPADAANKILIIVTQNGCFKSSDNLNNQMDLKLIFNGSDISTFAGALLETKTNSRQMQSASFSFLHSPASTTSVTYKTQFRSRLNTSFVSVQASSVSESTITLMEIAG